jgi:hypothetical protein
MHPRVIVLAPAPHAGLHTGHLNPLERARFNRSAGKLPNDETLIQHRECSTDCNSQLWILLWKSASNSWMACGTASAGLKVSNRQPSLYALLGVAETATLGDLRLAWRLRSLELDATGFQARDRAQVERAFNVWETLSSGTATMRCAMTRMHRRCSPPPVH